MKELTPFSTLFKTHQYSTVNAGETKRIFYAKIPEGHVGFISSLANNYFYKSKGKLVVDNQVCEAEIQRMVGQIDSPYRYEPPILANYEIEFHITNDDDEEHLFEVLIDGFCYKKGSGVKE